MQEELEKHYLQSSGYQEENKSLASEKSELLKKSNALSSELSASKEALDKHNDEYNKQKSLLETLSVEKNKSLDEKKRLEGKLENVTQSTQKEQGVLTEENDLLLTQLHHVKKNWKSTILKTKG